MEQAALADRLTRGIPVVVVGAPGVGKTTLLRAAVAASGRRAFEGGGLSALSWMSYLPLARALRESLPVGDPAVVAAHVAKRVDGGILLVDDLHWADDDTIALLPLLSNRIALVAAIRTADQGTRKARQAVEAAGFEVRELRALGDDEAHLSRHAHPGLGSADIVDVVGRAGANPLVLQELSAGGETSANLRLSLHARLTRREHEVLDLVAGGLTSGEIAGRLGVTKSTVETLVRSAMSRLDARTRKQAAALLMAAR